MKVLLAALTCLACASPALAAGSPWNGTWKLDPVRSSPGAKEGAAEDYRFNIRPDGQIRWEIPSLKEVVTGKTDGRPMVIRRVTPVPGLTLSVRPDGPAVLLYQVSLNGRPQGEGRMTLVENGRSWVDITWPAGRPERASEVVYVREK